MKTNDKLGFSKEQVNDKQRQVRFVKEPVNDKQRQVSFFKGFGKCQTKTS